jgi:hypothetical protein
MSNNTRQGGHDERFVVPLEASRRGAHRARVNPLVAALPMVAVAAVVAVVVALAYTLLAGNLFGGGSAAPGDDPPPVAAPTSSGRTSPSPSTTAEPEPTDTPPASQSPTTTPSDDPAEVDKTIRLAVFNGTGPTPKNGIGAKAATQLKNAGWTTRTPQTWRGDRVAGTTIYYATAAQQASAEALVEVLGVGVVRRSSSIANGGITVVIGNDWNVPD